MKNIVVLIGIISLITISDITSQELYSIFPINGERYNKKNGIYFPEHNVKIKEGSKVYNNDKLLFDLKLNGYFQYIYEIFEDSKKEKFLIISAVSQREDIGGYANFSEVKRGLVYVIPISINSSIPILYGDLENLTLNTKSETEYYSFGNYIESINVLENLLDLRTVKEKEESSLEIKLFEF
ncbi:hypothetical protein [Aureisphaera sp.]